MQGFLDEYKSRSRGLHCFDITTHWLLVFGMQIKLAAIAAFTYLVANKSRLHLQARWAASAFKQCWPLIVSPFIFQT